MASVQQPTDQLQRDAARIRRVLTGLTICIDCGAERAIGARECMSCRRCCSCGSDSCRREVCAEDAGIEAENFSLNLSGLQRVSSLVLIAFAIGPAKTVPRETAQAVAS